MRPKTEGRRTIPDESKNVLVLGGRTRQGKNKTVRHSGTRLTPFAPLGTKELGEVQHTTRLSGKMAHP